jgi:hypothetical protein
MGKTTRRFSRNEQGKEPKKKDKYKVNDQYKGQSLDDLDDDYSDVQNYEDVYDYSGD